jgi:sodium-coupled neutral amino acid transporter 11
MKTVIGAGILTLPYTVSKLGYIFGIFVFIFMIATVQFTSVLLLKAKNLSKHSNFSTIGYHTFRTRIVQVLGNVFILITNMGVCIV